MSTGQDSGNRHTEDAAIAGMRVQTFFKQTQAERKSGPPARLYLRRRASFQPQAEGNYR